MTASNKKQSCVRSRAVVFLLLLITIVASTAAQAAVWRVNAVSTAPQPRRPKLGNRLSKHPARRGRRRPLG